MKKQNIKIYHVECYMSPKGLQLIARNVNAEKNEFDEYYVRTKHYWNMFGYQTSEKLKVGTFKYTPNYYDKKIFDKNIKLEAWCHTKDVRKTKKILFNEYKKYINLLKKNIAEIKNEIQYNKKKLDNFIKGYKIYKNQIKESNANQKTKKAKRKATQQ